MAEITYNVLWIDDDDCIVESKRFKADEYNINLIRFSNWIDAEKELMANFNEYSAIILDANCKMYGESIEESFFLFKVLPRLSEIFGKKGRYIPWYILSAGTMDNFSNVVNTAADYRKEFIEEWGDTCFFKDAIDGDPHNETALFSLIDKNSREQSQNTILFRHKEVFSYLGDGKLIDRRARKSLIKMLSALYYPEENLKYEYAGNPLRKVLEYLFRAARKYELLPEECFNPDGKIVLQDSSRYMAGLNVKYRINGVEQYKVRWGEMGTSKDGEGGDRIFSKEVSTIVLDILNYSNADSHTLTIDDEPYLIDEETKEIFFGYVLQLCYVIRWFGKYVEEHPNAEENKKKHKQLPVKPKSDKEESIKVKEKPSSESVIGKSYTVLNGGRFYTVGNCKIHRECKATLFKKAKIVEVMENTEDDKEKFPFIVTKIEQE